MDTLKTSERDDSKELANEIGQELLSYVDNSLKIQAHKLEVEIANSQRYMNKAGACKYCGITNNTIDKWVTHGLHRIHIDGIIRFDKEDLDSFMSKYKHSS